MSNPETTILPIEDILKRLDSFIENNSVGTIFPENFFTSIRHHLMKPIQEGAEIYGGITRR